MPSNPLISVIIPSFNHAAFLPNAINSVLTQSVRNIEVIIVDDGSTDNSPYIIKRIQDSRVRSIILDKNQGAAAATNIGVSEAKASLIAICNSDDEWLPTKLADQFKIIHEEPSLGAVFTNVQWIDESGKRKPDEELYFCNIFKQDNKSRGFWLRSLLEVDNCLCHPSILIKREVYDNCGLYNNTYRQLPDYDMWLRLLDKYEIFVIRNKSIRFRIHADNTSKESPANSIRCLNEKRAIIAKAFNRMDKYTFANAFGTRKSLGDPDFFLPLEKVLYLVSRVDTNEVMFRDIGLNMLNQFTESEQNPSKILGAYGLSPDAYYTISGLSSPWHDRRLLGPFT